MELSRKAETFWYLQVMALPVRTVLDGVSAWELPSKTGRKYLWRGMRANVYCQQDSILRSPRRHTSGCVCAYMSGVFKEGRPILSVDGIILQAAPKINTVMRTEHQHSTLSAS